MSKGRAVAPILMSASQPFLAVATLDAGPPSTMAIMCATAFSSSTTRIRKGSLIIREIELAGRRPQAAEQRTENREQRSAVSSQRFYSYKIAADRSGLPVKIDSDPGRYGEFFCFREIRFLQFARAD